MSFVDLLGNDVWSDADITRRTESIIRAQFSDDEERILNRKITGLLIGQYTLTEADQVELGKFQEVVFMAQQEGASARTDMELLNNTLPVDNAYKRLLNPVVEDDDNDLEERTAAQEIVDNASEEIMNLVLLRNPV